MRTRLLKGDCLELLPLIPSASIDLVLCDLPYGVTSCDWDAIIPLEPLWKEYRRVVRRNAAIVLTASQPFTSALVMSNVTWFRYSWVWNKSHASNPMNARRRPLQRHEDILVFAEKGLPQYSPQMQPCEPFRSRTGKKIGGAGILSDTYGARSNQAFEIKSERFPTTDLHFSSGARCASLHPTEKPVALMEYLIRTYSSPDDMVLDNAMGSGTTGLAALNCGRRFIGMERDADYFEVARKRIANIKPNLLQAAE